MSSGFVYKKVLMIGGTAGIGEALANKFVKNGVHVIVSGRRQERLDAFVKQHGADKASTSRFDITELSKIPSWADSVHKTHPDLDCVFVNAGIQRPFNFADSKSVDLKLVDSEFTTNYLSCIHIAMAFLPYLQLQAKTSPTSLVFTTSGLAFVPVLHVPNYCATKAALHHWLLCFREQLRKTSPDMKVIELAPPAVQSELHDYMGEDKGRGIGMPMDEFIERAWHGLQSDDEEISVGFVAGAHEPDGFETKRQMIFKKINNCDGPRKENLY